MGTWMFCPKCGFGLAHATGIAWYCPNDNCEVFDAADIWWDCFLKGENFKDNLKRQEKTIKALAHVMSDIYNMYNWR